MKRFFLILITISFFSCAASIDVRETYPEETAADPQYGYMFGKLAIKSESGNFALEFFNVDNASGETVIISFKKYSDNINSAGLSVIPVQPGKYRLKNVLYLIGRDKLYSQKKITMSDVTREFTVEAGKCYYIGHWFAVCTETYTPEGTTVIWELDSITDQSKLAFRELHEQYPLFSGMELISFFPEKE